jgi:hypothetical protein
LKLKNVEIYSNEALDKTSKCRIATRSDIQNKHGKSIEYTYSPSASLFRVLEMLLADQKDIRMGLIIFI